MPLNMPDPPVRARDKTRSTLGVVARGRGAGLQKLVESEMARITPVLKAAMEAAPAEKK